MFSLQHAVALLVCTVLFWVALSLTVSAQTTTSAIVFPALIDTAASPSADSSADLFEDEKEIPAVDTAPPPKVRHAEPLYIDLIRDLGARRGERELNIAAGMTDKRSFDEILALVEYEWAPINRLGMEVELPFRFHGLHSAGESDSIPQNRLESLKLASQWTFAVFPKAKMSMAIGGIYELELQPFSEMRNRFVGGHLYNPFLVVAKAWGDQFQSLLYTGPRFHHADKALGFEYEAHLNLHWMIRNSRNFVGIETNSYYSVDGADFTIRPQMRLMIREGFLVGILGEIPISREDTGLGAFCRLIIEPTELRHKGH